MVHDLRLLLWLRIRHMRTFLFRLFHLAGTDLSNENNFEDRVYQLYAAALGVVWAVGMWAVLLDISGTVFAALGGPASLTVLSAALLAVAAVFAVSGIRALRASPLKLSHPDTPFLAASPLRSGVLVAVNAARTMVAGGCVAALGGFVLGAGLSVRFAAFASPMECAFVAALLVMAALGGAWLLGVARLALARGQRRKGVVLLGAALAAAAVCGALALAFAAPAALFSSTGTAAMCAIALVLVGGEAAALAVLSPRIDMAAVIQDNVVFADLQQFGIFSPLDRATIADYRRRRKLAARNPLFRMPMAQGRKALVARAAISLVRQYGGLPSLLMQGAVAAPLGVLALFGEGGMSVMLFWLVALVMFSEGARTATRAFRDDMRIRLVRDRLPFGTLELLVLNSLPAFVIVCAVSCASVVFALPAGLPLAVGIACAVLINAAVFLSCGLDAITLFRGGPHPFYEIGAIALVVGAVMLGFIDSAWTAPLGIALVCLVLASVIRGGVEDAS